VTWAFSVRRALGAGACVNRRMGPLSSVRPLRPLRFGRRTPRRRPPWDGVARYVRRAPGTCVWLGVLLVTTVVLHHVSPHAEQDFLRRRSTNLHELAEHPVRVLVVSALWTGGGSWLPYAGLYAVFHASVEHWLGTPRWLAVVAAAHVVATLVSEGVLLWAIRQGLAPHTAADAVDIGVSYALAGAAGVLTYRMRGPWRHAYAAGVLGLAVGWLVTGRSFTDLGHLLAVLVGLACRPLARCRVVGPPAGVARTS
jgi:hypothetical protein